MRTVLRTYAPYVALTLGIMLPLLLPGYILTLDLVFTPHLRAPVGVANDWLWQNFLHYLNIVVPSQAIEKVILVSIPLLSSISMHRLLRYFSQDNAEPQTAWHWAYYIGSILYAVNPFTYSRFMAGQYEVLLGYALLPFFVLQLLQFLDTPTQKSALKALVWALAISIVSIHAVGEMALISLVLFGWAILRPSTPQQKRGCLRWGLMALVLFVVLNSYWLVPLMLGKGSTALAINHFNSADSATFATIGDGKVGQLSQVLKLQGFWAEARGLYRLPADQFVGWGTLRLIIWVLVVWGAVVAWKQRRGLTTALGAIGLMSILFALGLPQGMLTHLGYREPQKFVGLLALVFSIFIAYGSARLLHKTKHHTGYPFVAAGLLVVVLIFTPTMYWGFGGQLKPREYPTSWQQANDWLNHDNTTYHVLFLPWHEYMGFGFSGRIIGNPATRFFDQPVIISNNPELGKLDQPRGDVTKAAISQLLNQPGEQLAAGLATYHIKYILLSQDDDYASYSYLNYSPHIQLVWRQSDLKIYRNVLIGGTQ